MKSLRFHFLAIAFVAVTVAVLLSVSGLGQSPDANKRDSTKAIRPALKPIDAEPNGPSSSVTIASAALASAAAQNELLRTNLNWLFGGKQQRGWYLYTPLISRMLNTEEKPASEGFASALSKWQQRVALPVNGLIDEQSFYAMVAEWQGKRLKDRTVATADQLLTAPVTDFYDPTREEELRQVEKNTYAAYQRMIKAAAADRSLGLTVDKAGHLDPSEKYLKIVSAFRSREYQDRLRQQSPNAGRAGLAINSPHFTGRALDLYVGGDPVDTTDSNRAIQVQTPVYLWLVRHAESFGFRPYFYEPWHWEYVGSEVK
ncbi:MAG TPA: D-alanyl-D-alanine carboxypeptidase family protein [Pyrinomonadaceae bacterium]